jgi:hypothetical protein
VDNPQKKPTSSSILRYLKGIFVIALIMTIVADNVRLHQANTKFEAMKRRAILVEQKYEEFSQSVIEHARRPRGPAEVHDWLVPPRLPGPLTKP